MIARAIRWSVLSATLNLIVQIMVMAALSRMLNAEDFGLYALAGLAMRFVTYFAQMGIGPAIIQRSELGDNARKTALFAAAVIGTVAWAAVTAAALPAATFFHDDRLINLLPAIGFTLFLAGLSSVPLALLRRDLDFRRLAVIEVAGLSLGYGVVSALCASQGLGVWSLVAGAIAQETIHMCGGLLLTKGKGIWRGNINRADLRDLWRYGSKHSVVSFMDFLSSNVETLFMGRVLGAAHLGIFNRAWAVTSLPVEQVMSAVGRVVFPAFARARTQPGHLGAGFILALQGNLLFAMPIGFGMAAAAKDLVEVVLGPNWKAAAEIAAITAFVIPWLYVSTVSGILMDAKGAFRKKGFMILGVTAVKLVLMIFLASSGLPGIALAMVIGELLRAVVSLTLASRLASVSAAAIMSTFLRALMVAAPVWAGISLVARNAESLGLAPLEALLLEITTGALLFLFLGRLQLISLLRDPHIQPVETELAGLRRVLRIA